MRFKSIFAITLFSLLALAGCTANNRARNFGGTETITLPPNRTLITATWKEANLWTLTRPRRDGEKPEEYEFIEKSSLGIVEGRVVIKEQ